MEMPTSIIEARGVGRRTGTSASWLLGPVDLCIEAGQSVSVVGPSGSGKTLLLRALALLDPIDQGEIRWRDQAIRGAQVPRFRSCVMYVRQRAAAFEGTIEESLQAPFSFHTHATRRYDRERIVGLLAHVGRDATFLCKRGRELSGGEAQIVALLRVLQFDPEVLLLDEPTAALDATAVRAVESLVQQWRSEQRDARACIWVSHDAEQAQRVSDRRIRLDHGRLDPAG